MADLAGGFIGLWILGPALVWDGVRGLHAFLPYQRHGDVREFKLQA